MVSCVEVTPSEATIYKGAAYSASAFVYPGNATNQTLKWYSSNSNIVSIDEDTGSALAKEVGTATIYACSQDGSDVCDCCNITVIPTVPVESVTVTPSSKTLGIGETDKLTATIYPSNATNKAVRWSSSDPNVVTVTPSTGEITAVAEGTATITAVTQDGSKKGSCLILVCNRHKVTVVSCSPEGWVNSSITMGQNMSNAIDNSGDYIVVSPTNQNQFENCWNISGMCLIIHTHGDANGLYDHGDGSTPRIVSVNEIKQIEKNDNINFIMMTSCSTAGGDPNNNVAYWLSKKINSNGLVIANKYKVFGSDTDFRAENDNQGWVAYKNGTIVKNAESMPIVLTMEEAYKIYKELI